MPGDIVTFIVLTAILLSPTIWLNYVFKKHNNILEQMPFTGLELGNSILQELGLDHVVIERTSTGDHYDLSQKKVMVQEERLSRKSLTAISIVCHEIGHAIQHHEKYKPLERRTKIVRSTVWLSRLASGIIILGLPVIMATSSFSLIKICFGIVVLSIVIGILVHLLTLDVELDASFNKALPIIKKKVPVEYHDACRSVLRAAALTYVAGVVGNILSLRYFLLLLTRLR